MSVIGIELVLSQPAQPPVISRIGCHHLLLHKIRFELEVLFMQPSRISATLGMPVSFFRTGFPVAPAPNALAKESQFKTQVYALTQPRFKASAPSFRASALGGVGVRAGISAVGGGSGCDGGSGGRGGTKVTLSAVTTMAKLGAPRGHNSYE